MFYLSICPPFSLWPRSLIRTTDTLARPAATRGPPPSDTSPAAVPCEGPLSPAVRRGRPRNPMGEINYVPSKSSERLEDFVNDSRSLQRKHNLHNLDNQRGLYSRSTRGGR